MIRDAGVISNATIVGRKMLRVSLMVALSGASATIVATRSGNASPGASQIAQQKAFATPQEAADALVQAAGAYDLPTLEQILGSDSEDLLSSEDPVGDKNKAAEFAAKGRQKTEAKVDPKKASSARVLVGDDGWPLPIPLIKKGNEWLFDTKAGRQEILYRRIGSNELDAIEICRGYVDAQHEYALEKRDNSEVISMPSESSAPQANMTGLSGITPTVAWGDPLPRGLPRLCSKATQTRASPITVTTSRF